VSIEAGRKLAHYEILELIGKGGMGEVYRAKDSKLGRDVAIKVLPDELAQDEERLRRFQREAKVLASLNHPNIAAIYGLERSGDTHYLILELVEGETLAQRIARGPIPIVATRLFEGNYLFPQAGRHYDVSADGQRFLMIKPDRSTDETSLPDAQIVFVQNWLEELKRLVPADN